MSVIKTAENMFNLQKTFNDSINCLQIEVSNNKQNLNFL